MKKQDKKLKQEVWKRWELVVMTSAMIGTLVAIIWYAIAPFGPPRILGHYLLLGWGIFIGIFINKTRQFPNGLDNLE